MNRLDKICRVLSRHTEIYHGRRHQRCLSAVKKEKLAVDLLFAAVSGANWWCRHGGAVPNCYRYPANTDRMAFGAVRVGNTLLARVGWEIVRANRVTTWGGVRAMLGPSWAGSPRYQETSSDLGELAADLLRTACSRLYTADIPVRAVVPRLPRGWCWGWDANGVCVRRPDGHEYHPSGEDLLCPSPRARIVVEAERTYRLRLAREQAARVSAAALASMADVTVTLEDSLLAGNCKTGTENWATANVGAGRRACTVGEILQKDRANPRAVAAANVAIGCQLVRAHA